MNEKTNFEEVTNDTIEETRGLIKRFRTKRSKGKIMVKYLIDRVDETGFKTYLWGLLRLSFLQNQLKGRGNGYPWASLNVGEEIFRFRRGKKGGLITQTSIPRHPNYSDLSKDGFFEWRTADYDVIKNICERYDSINQFKNQVDEGLRLAQLRYRYKKIYCEDKHEKEAKELEERIEKIKSKYKKR